MSLSSGISSAPTTPIAVGSPARPVHDPDTVRRARLAKLAPAQLECPAQVFVRARRAVSVHSEPGLASSSTDTLAALTPRAAPSAPVEIAGTVSDSSGVISVPVEANPSNLGQAARVVKDAKDLLSKSVFNLVSTIKKVCAYIAEAFKSFVENIKFKYQGYKAAKAIADTAKIAAEGGLDKQFEKTSQASQSIVVKAEAEAEQNRALVTAKDLGKRAGHSIVEQCPSEAQVLTSLNVTLQGFIGELKRRLEGKEITAGFMIAELKGFRDGLESVVATKVVDIGGEVSKHPKVSDYVMGLIFNGYEFAESQVEGLRSTFLGYAVYFAKMGTEAFTGFIESLSEASIVKGDRLADLAQHGRTKAQNELNKASAIAIQRAFKAYRKKKECAFEEKIADMNAYIDAYELFAQDAAKKAGQRDALGRLLDGLNSEESGRTLQLLNDLRVFIPALKNIEGAVLKGKVASLLRNQERVAQEAQKQADGSLEAILRAYRDATPSLQNGLLHRVPRLRSFKEIRNYAASVAENIVGQMRESMKKATDDLAARLDRFEEASFSDAEGAIDAVVKDHQDRNSWPRWFGSLARGTAKAAGIAAVVAANGAAAYLAGARRCHGV